VLYVQNWQNVYYFFTYIPGLKNYIVATPFLVYLVFLFEKGPGIGTTGCASRFIKNEKH